MSDWEQFLDHVSWFLRGNENVVVGAEQSWQREAIPGLPRLSALLESATVTPISVDGQAYELLCWGPADSREGWLSLPPNPAGSEGVHPIHRAFWTVSGGIVEVFGAERDDESGMWWLGQEELLTVAAVRTDVAGMLAAYSWIWEDQGLVVPDLDGYYVVAVEANGNVTLAHRQSGDLLLFAPDHAFDGVTPLTGSPPCSLLTIDDVPDLPTWIETSAAAQLSGV